MKLNELKNKEILILGFGREGKDTLKFLKGLFPKKKIAVTDAKFNKNYLEAIKNYDVVIKSPGIPPKVIAPFTTKRQKITSQTEIFLENCPGKIIGVTGTKGKSTTCFWAYQTLKKTGLPVKLVGNIERPALSFLSKAKKEDIFIYEMSSHQLYGLKKSPQVAVLLNIYPEHLDYYKSFKEYTAAKANIAKYQTKKDYLIYNSQDKICQKIAKSSKARKIPIYGEYYQLNLAAVKAAAKIFKAPVLTKLKNLPHRLEFIGQFKKINFYNDSLATLPEATIFALNYLGKNVQTLILGGFDRKQDFKSLAKKILKSKIKSVVLFPPSGRRIWRTLQQAQDEQLPKHFFVNKMADAVKLAYDLTGKRKICLLSPSSPSFGIFKDYKERGNLFKKWVKKYGKNGQH